MPERTKGSKTATKRPAGRFTDEERAAMREHAKEVKLAARRGGTSKEDGEQDVLAKIAEMQERDRVVAERVHALVTSSAPELSSRTWYGMPAYAKDGDVICYFQNAGKFKSRYSTFGFSDKAKLDDGGIWPIAFALNELTPAVEKRLVALVKKAVG